MIVAALIAGPVWIVLALLLCGLGDLAARALRDLGWSPDEEDA